MGYDDGIEWLWVVSYVYSSRGALRERASDYIRRIHSVNTKRSLDGSEQCACLDMIGRS